MIYGYREDRHTSTVDAAAWWDRNYTQAPALDDRPDPAELDYDERERRS